MLFRAGLTVRLSSSLQSWAIAQNKPKHANALLKCGANADTVDANGRGVFHMAVELDTPTCLQSVVAGRVKIAQHDNQFARKNVPYTHLTRVIPTFDTHRLDFFWSTRLS
jgi:hypothetical protein